MTKKELKAQEVLKRKEERRIAKENKDRIKAERARVYAEAMAVYAQKRREKEEKAKHEELIKQLIVKRKHESVFDDNLHLLEVKIPKNILKGDTNRVIKESVFFEVRNASFALTSAIKYSFKLPYQGTTKEHVNGRTNLGIYCAWLILNKKINNWEDLYNFLLRFGCWIYTTKQFNNHIEKFQNLESGAIRPEIYINEYEKYFNYKFSEEEKTQFSKRFLFSEYGVVTKDMIINTIREKK